MLRYPLNFTRQLLDNEVAAANLDFYATQCEVMVLSTAMN
eukprot:SAG31_NODE_42731_length_270_cov_0.608187_1_plen_39_part_10